MSSDERPLEDATDEQASFREVMAVLGFRSGKLCILVKGPPLAWRASGLRRVGKRQSYDGRVALRGRQRGFFEVRLGPWGPRVGPRGFQVAELVFTPSPNGDKVSLLLWQTGSDAAGWSASARARTSSSSAYL